MKDIMRRLLPGLALVSALGLATWMLHKPAAPPQAQVSRPVPAPQWRPDPRLATLDALVQDLEKQRDGLADQVKARDQRIEALQAELARVKWLLETTVKPAAPAPKPTKIKLACKCPPPKAKE